MGGAARTEPGPAQPWSAAAGCPPGSMLTRQGKLHRARLPLAQTAERRNLLPSEFELVGLARGSLRMTTGAGSPTDSSSPSRGRRVCLASAFRHEPVFRTFLKRALELTT
jgi:hypothetical protein